MLRFWFALVASASVLCATASPLAARVLPEDLLRLRIPSSAAISHDGRRVAFVVTRLSLAKNGYPSNIWLADLDRGSVVQLTRGESDSDPNWSPDDRTIAFTSGREKKAQIFILALSGGEALKLTSMERGAAAPRWSHDGKRILFGATVVDAPSAADVDWKALGIKPSEKQKKSDVHTIARLDFQLNGLGETYTKHQHIWIMNADGSHARALTRGHEWSERNAVWSYDDRTIVFNSLRRVDPERIADDVYTIPARGGALLRLALHHPSSEAPVWLHDNRGLVYLISSNNDPASIAGVATASRSGVDERTIVPENRYAFGDYTLSDTKEGGAGCGPLLDPSDRWFIADVSLAGATVLMQFDLANGAMRKVLARGDEISECSMDARGKRLAFIASDTAHVSEVYTLDLASGTTRALTHLNTTYEQHANLAPAEHFSVKDRAGFEVHAWFMRARGLARGARAATLLEIHGGPQTQFGNAFFHEMQFLASLGYNVVFADPRGSVGFGYTFTAALSKNWGDPMFEDLTAVMDAVTKRPDVDPQRLGVLGGSYGGYAALWIVGHTDRFKAAIAERPASNLEELFEGYDAAGRVSPTFQLGDPIQNYADYWRQSPIAYVANVHTPLLLIHSDEDIRTPGIETTQEFTALKALGRSVEYVAFPRENHDLNRTGEPLHRIERLHIIADWFGRYLR